MNTAHNAALERALVFAIRLAGSETTLQLFEDENRIALFLLPAENLERVRRAWRDRHESLTRAHQKPLTASPAGAARWRESEG